MDAWICVGIVAECMGDNDIIQVTKTLYNRVSRTISKSRYSTF